MIGTIRTHFDNSIKRCFPDAKDKKDPFGDDDISQTNLGVTYRVIFGAISSTFSGNSIIDNIPVSVDIFARGFNEPQEKFDEVYDNSILLRSEVVNPIETRKNGMAGITSSSITPSGVSESNDNDIQIRIEFDVTISRTIATREV